MADGAVSEPAAAKINPYLRVLGGRDDGYHEIETIVQPITLADGVQARPADGLRLTVAGPKAAAVPPGAENLVLAAARVLQEACATERGAHLLLVKRVPVGAGLGGGSADAAAALRALDRLWDCGLASDALTAVAAAVGSDVPALLPGGPVLVQGRGERVGAIHGARTWWVLLVPGFEVRAAEAYGWWDKDGGGTKESSVDVVLRALARGDAEELAGVLRNDLEGPVARRHPEVSEARERLLAAGALAAIMCGSGPAVAGLVREGEEAEGIAAATAGLAVAAMTSS